MARLELEASANWEEFLETRGGIKALERILYWKDEVKDQVLQLKMKGSTDGNGSRE